MNWRFWTWFDWKDGMWGPDPYNGTLVRSDMERFEVLGDDWSPEAVAQAKAVSHIEQHRKFITGTPCEETSHPPNCTCKHCKLVICERCGHPDGHWTSHYPCASLGVPPLAIARDMVAAREIVKNWESAHIPFVDEPQYTD